MPRGLTPDCEFTTRHRNDPQTIRTRYIPGLELFASRDFNTASIFEVQRKSTITEREASHGIHAKQGQHWRQARCLALRIQPELPTARVSIYEYIANIYADAVGKEHAHLSKVEAAPCDLLADKR
jgi:hypothetical protein